jgi:hypothetical protein
VDAVSVLLLIDQKGAVALCTKVLASGIWTEWFDPKVERISLSANKGARDAGKQRSTFTRTVHARKALVR